MKTTIYKKDSTGSIRVINVWTENDELIQESGLLEGKLVLHRKKCTPKNINKKNSTTGSEQALLEKESLIRDKLDSGYFTLQQLEEMAYEQDLFFK